MQIKDSESALAYDIEHFLTWEEIGQNKRRKQFEALIEAKFDIIRYLLIEKFAVYHPKNP